MNIEKAPPMCAFFICSIHIHYQKRLSKIISFFFHNSMKVNETIDKTKRIRIRKLEECF